MSMKYFLLPFMKYEKSENQFSEFSCLWNLFVFVNIFSCLVNSFLINDVYKNSEKKKKNSLSNCKKQAQSVFSVNSM